MSLQNKNPHVTRAAEIFKQIASGEMWLYAERYRPGSGMCCAIKTAYVQGQITDEERAFCSESIKNFMERIAAIYNCTPRAYLDNLLMDVRDVNDVRSSGTKITVASMCYLIYQHWPIRMEIIRAFTAGKDPRKELGIDFVIHNRI